MNAPVSKYVSHPVWQNAPRDLYLQEFLRLVVASIVDVPPPPYVGPPMHGSGGPLIDDLSQLVGFANPELIFDTMVGTGRAGTPGCNIVICNNELLPFSVADLLGDAAAQIGTRQARRFEMLVDDGFEAKSL